MSDDSSGSPEYDSLDRIGARLPSILSIKRRPVRMCLGCRERAPQDELIRLQLSPEGVVIVERRDRRLPGRSAYLCPKLGCLDNLLRRGEIAFKRSKYDKIIVRLELRQADRLRYAFKHAARRLRATLGVGPRD